MKKMIISIAVILAAGRAVPASGQACSCGGAPLMGSLELPTAPAGSWQFGLTYEYHAIGDVVSGTTELEDDTRRRTVHSGLLEINYGLSARFSASAVLTILQQERTTNSVLGTGELLQTHGVGDGIFMLKYSLLPFSPPAQRQVAAGAGVKMPFGKTSLTANSTLLAADMQPGTGSWDAVLWGYAYQGFYRYLPLGVQATFSYRLNGTNDRFGSGNQSYRFGNEFITTVAANVRPGTLLDYTLGVRYRAVTADEFAGLDLPNSGGKWVNLIPGINVNLTPTYAVRASFTLPVYRKLEGTQLTTSYAFSLSIFYSLSGPGKGIGI